MRHILLVSVGVVLICTAAPSVGHDVQHEGALLGYIPRASLQAVTMPQLEQMVDWMASLLDDQPVDDSQTRLVSRLLAPTLQSSNQACRNHTQIYWNQIKQIRTGHMELWAFAMLDATGKLPDGILVGNVNAFGEWDECLEVEVELDGTKYPDLPENARKFRGKYTPVAVFLAGQDPFSQQLAEREDDAQEEAILVPGLGLSTGAIGLCVPSSCSSEDVRDGLQEMLGENFTVKAGPSDTKTDTVELTWSDVFVIVVMSVIGSLMALAIPVDYFHRRFVKQQAIELQMTSVADSVNKRLSAILYIGAPQPAVLQQQKPPVLATSLQALVAFSPYTNVQKLLNTRQSPGTLTCLHGIRFLSMSWVVLGHAVSNISYYNQTPLVSADWLKNPLFMVIANATPSVDTFFLLSGLLLSYGFCSLYDKSRRFNPVAFYVHRWMRLTPALAMVVGILATWYTHLGNGPLWGVAGPRTRDNCAKYGWHELLFINNFFSWTDTCVPQAWYLAADTQMFVFSPLVLLPLVWKPLLGMLWLGLLTVAFLILRVVLWDVKGLPPTFLFLVPGPHDDELKSNYGYPWNRCTVWLLGISLGYLLHRLRGKKITLKPWVWLPAWLASFVIALSVVYGMCNYQMPWQPVSTGVAVVYGGLHRFAWGLAVSWVIFACVTGYGGWINTFLSYSAFVPLSRLTYSCYLVHISVITFVDLSMKGTLYMDTVRLVYRVFGHMITSLAFAVPLSLAFEVPFMQLEKLIFSSPKPKTDI